MTEVPGTSGTRGSDATKVSPAVSTSFQLLHTITITPAGNEYADITRVQDGIACNTGVGGATITLGYSSQLQGAAESGITNVGTATFGSSAVACTNNSYSTRNLTVAIRGETGKTVTIRFYIKTDDAVATTSMCGRDADVQGRLVGVIDRKTSWQKGWF